MKYSEWETSVPQHTREDPIWRWTVYRLARFAGAIAWADVSKLNKDRRTQRVADQLYRSIGSIAANLSEGYSRSSGADRSRFFEYALGSAREAREWYYLGEPLLGDEVVTHRVDILNQIIRLLVTMLPDQRKLQLKEDPALYNPTIDPSTNF